MASHAVICSRSVSSAVVVCGEYSVVVADAVWLVLTSLPVSGACGIRVALMLHPLRSGQCGWPL
ncbi:hypothetical protein JKG47_08970 [Acidithiobacillus sp. MC6.1]|nr:hypothetical protein [Acidithiobacillus sp. MC6.1]